MAEIELYGIPNCDTVKKARTWLDARRIDYVFHDYKKEGVDPERVERWIEAEGLDKLLNRRGTTWRKLPEADRARADGNDAVSLLVQHPSLIKRPVVEHDGGIMIGFEEDEWNAALT